MPSPNEKSIVLRKFDGVNILVDQAYLGPSYLALANNWIPGNTFRLTKMPGNAAYPGGNIPNVTRVLKLLFTSFAGHVYLYAVATPTAGGGDQLWVSVDNGAWAQVAASGGGNVVFATANRGVAYDMVVMNAVLYVGNGAPNAADPIVSVPVGGTGTTLISITAFTDGSAAPTLNTDLTSQILTGTYSYAWAIFDHTQNIWLERGQTRTVDVSTTGNINIQFPTPTGFATNSGVLSSRYRAHLFISPVNLPVEFGHDHIPDGLQTSGSFVCRFITADGPPLPLQGPSRTGAAFRNHRGRLWITKDLSQASSANGATDTAVWATYLTVPGMEQSVFNAGLFFPYNARTPRTSDSVTAIGLATTGGDDPNAPIIICSLSDTYQYFGDILDDPSAAFVKVSRVVGCINHDTMVETPWGTFYVGLQSVYMVPPGGGPPVDVGWPIRPAIQQIPISGRANCRAIYHKGFYKLALVNPGDTTAKVQWWLDLRNGVKNVPSWWGPHTRVGVSAWAVGQNDPNEPDRGYMAVEGGGTIEIIHQLNSAVENAGAVNLVSILQTGDLDDGRPFDRKIFTRVRTTLFPGASTTLSVGVSVDGGAVGPFDAMTVPAPSGAIWNVDSWNVSTWGQNLIAEGESVASNPRPRGRTGSVQIIHAQGVTLSLRDFELRYLPVVRPVRTVSTDQSS